MAPSTPYPLPESLAIVLCKREQSPTVRARSSADLSAQIEALYDLYAHRVFGFALWVLGSRDEAADVVQNTFLHLLTRKSSPGEIRDPLSFLLRVGRNAALDQIRKRRPTERLENDSLLAPSSDNPESRTRANEVTRSLMRLPVRQREALYLRFFLGLTYREIGRVTRVPTFTASSRCRLGLERLERRMASK